MIRALILLTGEYLDSHEILSGIFLSNPVFHMISAAAAAAAAMMGQPGLAAAAAAAGNPFLTTPFGMLGTAPRFR